MTAVRGRAPLRLGLGGGGTDVSPYSEQFGGRILSATVDRYAYASVEIDESIDVVEFHSPDRQRVGRAPVDEVDSLLEDFPLHVGVYTRMMKEFNGGEHLPMRLVTQVDAPPGSGLGSSSTVVVAMVAAIAHHQRIVLTHYELARLAFDIERVDLGMAGGWQDQYAASFGGFNYMESQSDGSVVVNPLRIRRETLAELEASLLLYFGGVSRSSADVIAEQQKNVRQGDVRALEATHLIRTEAEAMKDHLVTGDIAGFAGSLRDGWAQKKLVASNISNSAIERAYEVATEHGMIAGKVSGAGGGGFMMLLVDPARRLEVRSSLEELCGGTVSNCHFTKHGVETWNVPRGSLG